MKTQSLQDYRCPLILTVDDMPEVRAAIRFILEKHHMQVIEAGSTEEALELAGRHQFDLVLSDINRGPSSSGLEFLKILSHDYPNVPAAIISASLDEKTTQKARALGAFACLPKPFTYHSFLSVVHAALASHREKLPVRS